MYNYSILNQSDARLKTNIEPTNLSALDIINRVRLKSFDWIETGEHEEIGIIAQQLREIVPDLVAEDPESGRLSVKTDKFIPYLIKAVQEIGENRQGIQPMSSPMALQPEEWQDDMTFEEKREFIEATKTPLPEPQTEVIQEPIFLPG